VYFVPDKKVVSVFVRFVRRFNRAAGYCDRHQYSGQHGRRFLGVSTEIFVTDDVTVGVETFYHDFGDLDGAPRRWRRSSNAFGFGFLNYRF
jgi:hypothetical protein